jgi:hypothetical protein
LGVQEGIDRLQQLAARREEETRRREAVVEAKIREFERKEAELEARKEEALSEHRFVVCRVHTSDAVLLWACYAVVPIYIHTCYFGERIDDADAGGHAVS